MAASIDPRRPGTQLTCVLVVPASILLIIHLHFVRTVGIGEQPNFHNIDANQEFANFKVLTPKPSYKEIK